MFTGLTAFPLTPLNEERIDEATFSALIGRLAQSGVDALGVLGSTGSYVYLTRQERQLVVELAVQAAEGTPVIVGVGALRTRDVLALAEDAQAAGAAGLLLAPVSYHPLSDEEVFDLFRSVCAVADVPVIVYDNPGTTHFTFSHELHARLAQLDQVKAVKIPPVPLAPELAAKHLADLQAVLLAGHDVGISGDASAAVALTHGCTGWYSMIGGVLPEQALALTRAAQAGDVTGAMQASQALEPIWALYRRFGSLRTVAAIAAELGHVSENPLPLPLHPLPSAHRVDVRRALTELGVE